MKAGKSGITKGTPKKIMFGAGTIHKNLKYTSTTTFELTTDTTIKSGKTYYTRSGTSPNYTYSPVSNPVVGNIGTYYEQKGSGWNYAESCIGATLGGSKITITPEFVDIEADGALVLVKGMKVKTGETASMEINLLELTKDVIKDALVAQDGNSEDTNFDLIESKAQLEEGDYYDNIAFVGQNLDGKNIIVIMDNALCTSGFESEGKNKEAGVGKYTFECHADLDGELDTLPYHIYYPKASA